MARAETGRAPPPQRVTGVMSGGMNGHEDKGRREGGRFLSDAAGKVSAHAVAMPTTHSHANTRQAGGHAHEAQPGWTEPRPTRQRSLAHAVTSLLGEETETTVRMLAGPQTKG